MQHPLSPRRSLLHCKPAAALPVAAIPAHGHRPPARRHVAVQAQAFPLAKTSAKCPKCQAWHGQVMLMLRDTLPYPCKQRVNLTQQPCGSCCPTKHETIEPQRPRLHAIPCQRRLRLPHPLHRF